MLRPIVIVIAALISSLLVIAVYYQQFGGGFSNDHSRWGDFGSYFGGVLGAVFGFSSLLYLAVQVKQQSDENRRIWLRSEIDRKEQSISTYLMIIRSKLKESDPNLGAPLAELLLRIHDDPESGKNEEFVELIRLGLSARSEAIAVWMNISAALSYLREVNEHRYIEQLNLISVQLGYRLCSALDDTVELATGRNVDKHFDR